MRIPLRTATPSPGRLACQRCGAPFDPSLTRGDCPVCGLVGDAAFHVTAADAENRPVTLAIAAMAVNLVVFALIAWAVLG